MDINTIMPHNQNLVKLIVKENSFLNLYSLKGRAGLINDIWIKSDL